MDLERARSLLDAERAQVRQLLADLDTPQQMTMRPNAMRLIRRSHWQHRASTTPWPPDYGTGSRR